MKKYPKRRRKFECLIRESRDIMRISKLAFYLIDQVFDIHECKTMDFISKVIEHAVVDLGQADIIELYICITGEVSGLRLGLVDTKFYSVIVDYIIDFNLDQYSSHLGYNLPLDMIIEDSTLESALKIYADNYNHLEFYDHIYPHKINTLNIHYRYKLTKEEVVKK